MAAPVPQTDSRVFAQAALANLPVQEGAATVRQIRSIRPISVADELVEFSLVNQVKVAAFASTTVTAERAATRHDRVSAAQPTGSVRKTRIPVPCRLLHSQKRPSPANRKPASRSRFSVVSMKTVAVPRSTAVAVSGCRTPTAPRMVSAIAPPSTAPPSTTAATVSTMAADRLSIARAWHLRKLRQSLDSQ